MINKVQTNDQKVNVLVETVNSNNRHYFHGNREVINVVVLSDDEVISVWINRPPEDDLEMAKQWIKKQDGYAISNCADKTLELNHSDIVKYQNL